jgi:hypothetical protein
MLHNDLLALLFHSDYIFESLEREAIPTISSFGRNVYCIETPQSPKGVLEKSAYNEVGL